MGSIPSLAHWRMSFSAQSHSNCFLTIRSLGELMDTPRTPRPVMIDGLLRRGETANLVAAPKTGKSFLVLDLALAVASGNPWLEFPTHQGRVLVIDNELHEEQLLQRANMIMEARGHNLSKIREAVDVVSLRGMSADIFQLAGALKDIVVKGDYSLLILDALYRFIPNGMNENENGHMTAVYNSIDSIASSLDCAIVCVHHTSKGKQGPKETTDVGAGAGAISRAVDTHIVLRKEKGRAGTLRMDVECRSFDRPQSVLLRKNGVHYDRVSTGAGSSAIALCDAETADQLEKPEEVFPQKPATVPPNRPKQLTPGEFARKYVTDLPMSKDQIVTSATADDISPRTAERLLNTATGNGIVVKENAPNDRRAYRYRLASQEESTSGDRQDIYIPPPEIP